MAINHQNNFATTLSSPESAGVSTLSLTDLPSVDAPFYLALDATNINGKYEVILVTSKGSGTVSFGGTTSYAHTVAEEVRMVAPAAELDSISNGWCEVPGTLTYSSADSPTFVATTSIDLTGVIGVGNRIKLSQTTAKYFIVTAIDASTITLYGGTDYTLANAAITSPYFSIQKAPLGFPLDPAKWTVSTTDTSSRVQTSPVNGTVYNPGSLTISIPIGVWRAGYEVVGYINNDSATDSEVLKVSFSTANNSISDATMTSALRISGASGNLNAASNLTRERTLTIAAKTAYYLVCKVDSSVVENIGFKGDYGNTNLYAICAYL